MGDFFICAFVLKWELLESRDQHFNNLVSHHNA